MAYPRNPRATLWLFAYQGMTEETFVSVMQEQLAWGANLSTHVKGKDANIDRARSKVASWFLSEPRDEAGDVLLMVDSDNAWETGGLTMIARRALEHNAVVGGIYPKKAFGQSLVLRVSEEADGEFTIGEDKMIPTEFVGTGMIAIPRAVLEMVADVLPTVKGDFQPFFMPYLLNTGLNGQLEYPTDDQAFCARVRECGLKVYVSTYPKVTHVGQYEFRGIDAYVRPKPDEALVLNFDAAKRKEQLAHA